MQETHSNQALYKRLGIRLILAIIIILFLIYGLPLAFQLFYPFIFAFVLAALANPLVNIVNRWLSKTNLKSTTSRSIITLLITIIILLALIMIIYLIISTVLQEIFGLANNIQANWPSIVEMFENTERWLRVQLNVLPTEALEILEGITENLLAFIRNFSSNLLNYTVSITGSFFTKAGSVTLNMVTFFLSLYFFMTDFDLLKNFVKQNTDVQILKTFNLLKRSATVGVGGYVKTQVILAFIAFGVMFVAFTIYGVEYALTIAIFLGIIDIIPLIGTIAILLPWGIFELVLGDTNFGVFLVALGIGFFLFRRMIEPKIMGSQTGLHPLFALIGIYVGIQFSGLWGALLGPLVMVVFIGVVQSGILDNTFADISGLYHKIAFSLRKS